MAELKTGTYIEDTQGVLYTVEDWGKVKANKTPNSVVRILSLENTESNFRIALTSESLPFFDHEITKEEINDHYSRHGSGAFGTNTISSRKNTELLLELSNSNECVIGYCNSYTFPDGKTKGCVPSSGALFNALGVYYYDTVNNVYKEVTGKEFSLTTRYVSSYIKYYNSASSSDPNYLSSVLNTVQSRSSVDDGYYSINIANRRLPCVALPMAEYDIKDAVLYEPEKPVSNYGLRRTLELLKDKVYPKTSKVDGSSNVVLDADNDVIIVNCTDNISSVSLSKNPVVGKTVHAIFTADQERTVTIAHDNTDRVLPEGSGSLILTIPANGYVELNFLYDGTKTYVRGL